MSEPQIRVREERAVTFRLEPLPDGNPAPAPGPPRAGAPRAAASTTVRRYPVQKVTLQFKWGDEQPVGPSLVVGTDPARR
jgi:hypothetical protein